MEFRLYLLQCYCGLEKVDLHYIVISFCKMNQPAVIENSRKRLP